MHSPGKSIWFAILGIVVTGLSACMDDASSPAAPETGTVPAFSFAPSPPDLLVTARFGDRSLRLWPYTGIDLANKADPMNLLFTGHVDVVSLRAALMSLDGNRTAFGFPNAFPFNCTWTDASGDMQTSWSSGDGWVSNPVQLQCGAYDPLRFHIRLFPAGKWVLGGVHFDLLIPQTPQHQVISWELGQALVVADFVRSGLLDPERPMVTAPINPMPSFRDIPAIIYDGIPAELKALLGGPPSSGGSPVPIPSDGMATILNLGKRAKVTSGQTQTDFIVAFDQIIPRPFCERDVPDVVLIQGPVRITTYTRVTRDGLLVSRNTLRGELSVTPINPLTGEPGVPFRALIETIDNSGVSPAGAFVSSTLLQTALPPAVQENGSLFIQLTTAPHGFARFIRRERC